MSKVIFYTNPMSRGQIARWALHEVGAEYDAIVMPYGPKMREEAYKKINPMSKVPAIVHEGQVVTECAAICAYLGDAFASAQLGPKPEERADYYRYLFFSAGPLEAAVMNNQAGFHVDQKQEGMAGYGSFERAIDALETMLSDKDFVCGTRFTMADVYVGSQIGWGLSFKTMPARPVFERYVERIFARPKYQEAKAIDQALIDKQNAESSPE